MAGLDCSVGVGFCCMCVFSADIWWTLCALPLHHGCQRHFVSISDFAKAWDDVYGEVYEHR